MQGRWCVKCGMRERKVYLDSSALVKRYVREEGTEAVDSFFREAEEGSAVIYFSAWNLGEVAGVFVKYARNGRVDERKAYGYFLNETARLRKPNALEIVPVTLSLISKSAEYVFKHHIYIADAIQLASSIDANCDQLVTSDNRLHRVANSEGLRSLLI